MRKLKHTKDEYIESGVAEWLAAYPEMEPDHLRFAMVQLWNTLMEPLIEQGKLIPADEGEPK